MATRVNYNTKEVGLDAITLAGRIRLGRVQSAEIAANLPNTQIAELGSDKFVGRVFDPAEVTATVQALDVGPRTDFFLAGKDFVTAASGTYVELQEMKYSCLVQTFKALNSTDIAQSLFVPGARLNRYTVNYAVGQDLTEEFAFDATDRRWLKYDVAVASGVTASGSLTFSPAARILKDGTYVLSVFASGVGYLPQETILASTATTVTLDTTSVPDGTYIVVMYHSDLSNQWEYTYQEPHVAPGYTPPPDQPVGMRGYNAEVYLVKSGVSNDRIYRAQTLNLQAQFPTTRVQELGNEAVVGYSDGIPDITGSLEIMTFDFHLQEQLSGDTSGDNWSPNDLGTGDWGLLIKLYRRGVNRSTTKPDKEIFVAALDITSETNRAQANQDARQTFNIAARNGKLFIAKGTFSDGTGLPWTV